MKPIICFTTLLLLFASITFSQSVMDFQASTGIEVQAGADICADQVQISGTFSGGGTICGGQVFILNLTAFIEGFYRSSSHSMIQDTMTVYLRKAVPPYIIVDSAKNVLSSSGDASFVFLRVTEGIDYFIVLKHRNSIETWSSNGIPFSSGLMTFDFSPAPTKAFANNQIQVDVSPIRFAIYSGDVNQDGIVDASDISAIEGAVGTSGYVPTDLTGDDFVDASDLSIVENNAGILARNPIVGYIEFEKLNTVKNTESK